jgi:hypothetical protein
MNLTRFSSIGSCTSLHSPAPVTPAGIRTHRRAAWPLLCLLFGLGFAGPSCDGTEEVGLGQIAACPRCDQCPDPCCCCDTPIVLDVAGDGVKLTSWQDGVPFELKPWQPSGLRAWTEKNSDDAWLAYDVNGNGTIDNGPELFGNTMTQPDPPTGKHKNGFLALAQYDLNGDRVIDQADAIYKDIRAWQDRNHDGVSQMDELSTLPDVGVAGLAVDYTESRRGDEYGNAFRYRAVVYGVPGAAVGMTAWDVMLRSPSKEEREALGIPEPQPPTEETLPDNTADASSLPITRDPPEITYPCHVRPALGEPGVFGGAAHTFGGWQNGDSNGNDPCPAAAAGIYLKLEQRYWNDFTHTWSWKDADTNSGTVPPYTGNVADLVEATADCVNVRYADWRTVVTVTPIPTPGYTLDPPNLTELTTAYGRNCQHFPYTLDTCQ